MDEVFPHRGLNGRLEHALRESLNRTVSDCHCEIGGYYIKLEGLTWCFIDRCLATNQFNSFISSLFSFSVELFCMQEAFWCFPQTTIIPHLCQTNQK